VITIKKIVQITGKVIRATVNIYISSIEILKFLFIIIIIIPTTTTKKGEARYLLMGGEP
jgi:hypothetical protein